MPYIINKTNGAKIVVVDDAEIDNSTDISFIGRNYNGYGEVFNENFVRLLENFSNDSPTTKPISGQTWFNSSTDVKKLNVFDGKQYKSIANLHVSPLPPTLPTIGDLWWDENNVKLKLWNGSTYKVIGPQESARADIRTVEEVVETSPEVILQPVIEAFFGGDERIVISDTEFTPAANTSLSGKFPIVKKGITLLGADAVTGSSTSTNYYFWGTAAESLRATTATTTVITFTNTNQTFYVPFANSYSGSVSYFAHTGIAYNPSTGVLNTIASSSQYADLAERYEADQNYDVGTVLVIGGAKEITTTHSRADTTVIGVVSQNPAFRMNSDVGTDETHPYIALRGRVPCKVIGAVKKGQLLVTSSYPGYAEAMQQSDNKNAVFAKSLVDFAGPKGMVEVLVI